MSIETPNHSDEDGDGVPDGRFDPNDPIGTDGTDLSDIVNGPQARQTVATGPEHSSGTIGRPGEEGLFSMDAGTMEVRKDSGEAHVVDGSTGFIGETEKNVQPAQLVDDITGSPVVMSGGSTMATPGSPEPAGDEGGHAQFRPEVGDEVVLEVAQVETAIPAVAAPVPEPDPAVFVEEVSDEFQAMPELDASIDAAAVPLDDHQLDDGA